MRKSNIELAEYAYNIYTTPSVFSIYENGADDKNVCYGIFQTSDENIVALRGSMVLKDWIRDLNAIANPFIHSTFGPVHPGFLDQMEDVVVEIYNKLDHSKPITITGHSLGAGRAAILVALFLQRGVPANQLKRVVFGEPKSGFVQLANYIGKVPSWSYRNGDAHFFDLVTALPFSFPPEEYVRASPLIEICQPPSQNIIDQMAMISWHHMLLYVEGVKKGPLHVNQDLYV